ncbi:hypothetical protein FACS189444_0180 [Spirochaetia bacterium]|nr:hypothetical protein FACS189444_0180 [Spirochaetia bacterium]
MASKTCFQKGFSNKMVKNYAGVICFSIVFFTIIGLVSCRHGVADLEWATATLINGNSIKVDWNDDRTPMKGIGSYDVDRKTDNGEYEELRYDTFPPYVDNAIESGHSYQYRVRGESGSGVSDGVVDRGAWIETEVVQVP